MFSKSALTVNSSSFVWSMDDNLKIRRLSEPFVGELSGELETLETKKICLSAF